MSRGSLQYWHRKRASRQLPRSRNYQKGGPISLSEVIAYKAGMVELIAIDDSESPTKNQEVARACTVLEFPRTELYGIRLYKKNPSTNYEFTEAEVYDADAAKRLGLHNKNNNLEQYKAKIADYCDVSALLVAHPDTTSMSTNRLERFEAKVSGKTTAEKLEFLTPKLGKEIKLSDIFKKGEKIDLAAVTKGKGWQGPVKRFGVHRLFHKATQKQRHVGTHGPFTPGKMLYSIPHAGQMGYNTRTELNKMVMQIGAKETASQINGKAGFSNYGAIKNDYIVVDGSVPGPAKRVVRLRRAIRSHQKEKDIKEPKVLQVLTN